MSQARTDSIYWDEETKARAEALARRDDRSVSGLIRHLVNRAWEAEISPAPARMLVDSETEYVLEGERV